ncbi:MAG TPA: sensor domain-containing diguanylate cyclase [Longimicrobiales bacterium]|nr:sensor domain-containing diguanylate cyclase [Longimicrobiales bacterium]
MAGVRQLSALEELSALDTSPEERFDRLTRLARRIFDVPVALVTLVDSERQWFKSRVGLDASEPPREWAFCSVAIAQGCTLVVEDALQDERFRENPLVRGDTGIRFYAGQPIAAPNGAPIGTLCIIDRQPRSLSTDEEALLSDVASLVEREFATMRLATMDELTGLSNRRGFNVLAKQTLAMCDRAGRPATLVMFDLDGFKQINDSLGHAEGDVALISFAGDLLANYRESDVVARLGGDEFCVLLSGAAAQEAWLTLEKLAERTERRNQRRQPLARIRYSVGVAAYDPLVHAAVADLLNAADQLMYEDKRRRA